MGLFVLMVLWMKVCDVGVVVVGVRRKLFMLLVFVLVNERLLLKWNVFCLSELGVSCFWMMIVLDFGGGEMV